jgi:beta-glucosidase
VSRLTTPQLIAAYQTPANRFTGVPSLNLKSLAWDATCIHGVSTMNGILDPHRNTTVFAHAIAQGATWDPALVARASLATQLELRAINVENYAATNRWMGTSCDGGALANTAHDARWGRIAETFGEDPFLAARTAVAMTAAVQGLSADGRWLAVSSVTRHWLGFHYANDLPNGGEETISLRDFEDQQAPVYFAASVEARAEGLMCAMSSFSVEGGPMTPSCLHPFLWGKLRGEWGWQGLVQTDCCDSLQAAVKDHHYNNFTYEDVAVAALRAGVQLSYSYGNWLDVALNASLNDGRVTRADLAAAVGRSFATRFKTGEFDATNPQNPIPFSSFNVSVRDSPAHRELARELVGASLVLLENANGALPLRAGPPGAPLRVLVAGPFSDCSSPWGGYGIRERNAPGGCSYHHSYSGGSSYVATVLSALQAEPGLAVAFSPGTYLTATINATAIADAAAAAAAADVVVLSVGLSTLVEAEGLDRVGSLGLPQPQQALLEAVAAAAGPARVVLLIHSAGGVDVDPALFGAALQVWYGGQETGRGVADVLLGRVNPSARLPLTVFRSEYLATQAPMADFNMVNKATGVGRTYRYVGAAAGAPYVRWWFGRGLSYTRFTYGGLQVAPASGNASVGVAVGVENTGSAAGAEVVQVYLSTPPVAGLTTPLWSLVAFNKTSALQPGAGALLVGFSLDRAALTTVFANGTRGVVPGAYTIYVGGSSPAEGAALQRTFNFS